MEETLSAHDLDPSGLHVLLEVTGNEAVRQALKAGAGIAVISRRAIRDDVRCKMIVALRLHGVKLSRDFYLVTHKSRSRSPLAEAFLKFLHESAPPPH
jgi:DNA-binding transcriptional LysR family regulator